MNPIYVHVKKILNPSYKILFELEKEKVDLEKIENLFNIRSNKIKELDQKAGKNINIHLSTEEKQACKKLFTRFNQLEEKINKGLAVLSKQKKEALHNLEFHKKAKSSYAENDRQTKGRRSKIVDLKSEV